VELLVLAARGGCRRRPTRPRGTGADRRFPGVKTEPVTLRLPHRRGQAV